MKKMKMTKPDKTKKGGRNKENCDKDEDDKTR